MCVQFKQQALDTTPRQLVPHAAQVTPWYVALAAIGQSLPAGTPSVMGIDLVAQLLEGVYPGPACLPVFWSSAQHFSVLQRC